ncbi:tRNA guanosine(34) transglycosylase Tgt [Candidatus Peregrinibacteria bacterium]|nr:tRNA guanosine(34) transglycosylase Tgt [Candidatus Peregrinibacteria bacterium]
MFNFTIHKTDGLARTGSIKTPHGIIKTPVFMPVGTKATVKTLSPQDLKNLQTQIILANTYHLFLRPGHKVIKKLGGLHKWMNWQHPILTDSGGYQVFSLGQEKGFTKNTDFKTSVKIDENGVEFRSHIDGKKHYLTPKQAIEIQHDLGADIIMAFDECAPANSSKQYFKEAMQRTHNWLKHCINAHKSRTKTQALFGIVQGGIHKNLRIESAKFINDQNLPGNAIGGLAIGESKATMLAMIETTIPHLSTKKPRYLMGVGTPEDLLECVERGIDMFDCVHPTRLGRHGPFWHEHGRASIRNEKFKLDKSPLQKNCLCETCQDCSKSYLRHLIFENEILGLRLMTIHNLHFLLELMRQIHKHIEVKSFSKFKKDFLKKFHAKS